MSSFFLLLFFWSFPLHPSPRSVPPASALEMQGSESCSLKIAAAMMAVPSLALLATVQLPPETSSDPMSYCAGYKTSSAAELTGYEIGYTFLESEIGYGKSCVHDQAAHSHPRSTLPPCLTCNFLHSKASVSQVQLRKSCKSQKLLLYLLLEKTQ